MAHSSNQGNSIMSVDIKPHPTSDEHWFAIVTTKRGYCFFATYAGPKPTEEKVKADWYSDGGSRSYNWKEYHG